MRLEVNTSIVSSMASEKATSQSVVSDPKPSAAESTVDSVQDGEVKKVSRISSILTVMVAGLALFSDGYNAQIIGYMKPLFSVLYKDGMSSTMNTRLSNSYLIGEVFGMLFFGWIIDKIGRRTGIVFATLFLVLGIVVASKSRTSGIA